MLAAVYTALAELVNERVLSVEQGDQVAARLQPILLTETVPDPELEERPSGGLLTEIAGYLGGALVLSGAAAMVVPAWNSIPAPVRFGLALLATLLLGGGLVTLRRTLVGVANPEARLRLASTLGALAAGAASIAAAVPAPDRWEPLAGALAALLVAGVGYALVQGAPLLAAGWVASLVLLEAVLDHSGVHGTMAWSTLYAALAVIWLALGFRKIVAEGGVAALLGGLTGFSAAEAAMIASKAMAAYGLLLGLGFAAACFGIYLTTRSWPALVPAVLIALVLPATALAILFSSVLAAGVVVAIVGIVLLVVGWLTMTDRRESPPVGQ